MVEPAKTVTMQKRQLGVELRRLRDVAGLLQDEAAERLGKNSNKISRVENGKVSISSLELDTLLTLYKASEKDRFWCRELAKGARRRVRSRGAAPLKLSPPWFRAYREYEQNASEIMFSQSGVVPGILQTEDYIRGIFSGVDPHGEIADRNVLIRQERQRLLTRENGPRFSFVLCESVLRRQVGGHKVMAAQLDHLAEVARLPNVTIQVIPFDSLSMTPAVNFNFVIFRFEQDSSTDIVYVELSGDALYIDKPPEVVSRYTRLLNESHGAALGPIESRNLILEVAHQFK